MILFSAPLSGRATLSLPLIHPFRSFSRGDMQITVNTRRERGIFDEGTSCNNNYRGWRRVRVARDEYLRRLMAREEFDVMDIVFFFFF